MIPTPRTRREILKVFGVSAGLSCAWPAGATTLAPETVRPAARFFPLSDVRLGEGPFLVAQRLDAAYLLRLEPDRMLHNFRANAGLEPKAAVYGGWESIDPWIEIRCHGHTLGHYLTACACMYASTGEVRFAERVDHIVGELAACQAACSAGWLVAFPDGTAPLVDSLAGKPFAGVPWYTTHKVMAGLRDAHLIRGSSQAREVLVRFADWIDDAAKPVGAVAMQRMLDREHGGMNEVLADLAAITGNNRYRDLAVRFSHRALFEPLAAGRDTLDGLHSNTQIPKVIGFSRIYDISGRGWESYDTAAKFFWRSVVEKRSFATGGHGDSEHFFPPGQFAEHLSSGKTMETCCTHNMMRLTRSLFGREPLAAYTDYFERALFNGILAAQDPDSGMNTYFQSTRAGYVKLYHTPFDSFWCCTGSGIENHARYGETIYAQDADTLYVNLFLASTLHWRERGLKVVQATAFPDTDHTRLEFSTEKPQAMRVAFRQPAWCAAMTVTVNGRRRVVARQPGSYYLLNRTFRQGDVVEVRLPMRLKLEPLPHSPEHAAVMYGPIVLAARLGTQGLTTGSQLIVNERESGQMLNEPVAIPVWGKPLEQMLTGIERSDPQSLRFTGRGFADGASVEFIPWFRIAHERHNLYWRALTAS